MAWLIDRIVAAILSWLTGRGISLIKQKQNDDAIDERMKEEAEAVKKAKTPEEFDDAARDVLSR